MSKAVVVTGTHLRNYRLEVSTEKCLSLLGDRPYPALELKTIAAGEGERRAFRVLCQH